MISDKVVEINQNCLKKRGFAQKLSDCAKIIRNSAVALYSVFVTENDVIPPEDMSVKRLVEQYPNNEKW